MTIKLAVNNFKLVSSHHSGILVGAAERTVVEQEFPPNVWTK